MSQATEMAGGGGGSLLARIRAGLARWLTWAKTLAIAGIAVVLLAAVLGAYLAVWFQRDVPQTYADVREHFKYGSIGAEAGAGIPYWIWQALPAVFPEYLPDRPGDGYERIGFIYETPESERPIGTGYRELPIGLVGLNCAACHTGTVQEAPDAPKQIVLGMPAHDFDLQAYARFLFAAGNDDRFNAGVLMPAIDRLDPDLSWFERLLYRYLVIPRTRDALRRQSRQFEWMIRRPPSGPGRVDTFNPFNAFFGLDPGANDIVGTADLPSLWHQKVRSQMHLHWDGNNDSVDERNINAAIGAGAIDGMQDHIDLEAIRRIAEWEWDQVDPPPFPADRIDRSRTEAGRAVYEANCASCHALDGAYVGQVTDISEIGTDRERLDSFTEELVVFLNRTGAGRPWAYSHFKKTNGYANSPLDGIWLRAPYLHNGSVPTVDDLLKPTAQRPATFYTGYDVYDFDRVGFVSSGPGPEQNGVLFDTSVRGNGNGGHEYGATLSDEQKRDLIQYLKTQ